MSQSYSAVGDLLVEKEWSGKNCYPFEASMKKLINDEISKNSSTRQNAPSIVARLMGMDMSTLDTKPGSQPSEKKYDKMRIKSSNKEASGRGLIGHVSSNSNSSRQMKLDLSYHDGDRDSGRWNYGQRLGKPRSREHPQEEELQKFKKEFEAWQAERFRECSRFAELGSMPSQLVAQEDLNKVKLELCTKTGRAAGEKPVRSKGHGHAQKARAHDMGDFQHHEDQIEAFQFEERKYFPSQSRTSIRDFEQPSMMSTVSQKLFTPSAPTRIVILKPGPDRFYDPRESWTSSPSSLEPRGSIEDFLEEVKERLKCEMQGKMLRRGSVVRGSGIETPYSEKPSDPKQIAQNIAKQVRESVSKDIGTNLPRSESARSYKSEVQFNGPSSPGFISRDTRRFVSERLKNVLKRETGMQTVVGGHTRSYSVLDLDSERVRAQQGGDTSKSGNELSNIEILRDEREMKTRSFRHRLGEDGVLHRELSPRNLVRSLSAPVSGTSFGKLLLEDRHILTGAHIRRKHEACENAFADIKKRKKERFNFKEKVSNFRYSFSLGGRLFGKKIQSVMESHVSAEHYPVKDIMSGPTVVTNSGEKYVKENFTEVPPSPASVCSSAQEEFWRPVDHLSPLSTPTTDVTPGDNDVLPQVFREISSNLNELRRQLNQLESDEPEESIIQPKHVEFEIFESKDPAEAYIRDLLVASGLYDGSSDKFLWRWETFSKPISMSVFEEVEESYQKLAKDQTEKKVDHKLLLDLLNEALSTILGPPSEAMSTASKFRRNLVNASSSFPTLRGKKLLDCVWEIICEHLNSPTDRSNYSLEGMVGRDLRLIRWSGLMEDEASNIGREMESLIMGDLVKEILEEMQL